MHIHAEPRGERFNFQLAGANYTRLMTPGPKATGVYKLRTALPCLLSDGKVINLRVTRYKTRQSTHTHEANFVVLSINLPHGETENSRVV